MTKTNPPIAVIATRGDAVESRHAVHAAAVDAQGKILRVWGDADQAIFPRSANKMIQALPLLESGAADKLGLGDEDLALACASHNGEPRHANRVKEWLTKIGFDDAVLECGTHWPYHEDSAYALARTGAAPCPYHNNCSGKHAGMVSTAWALDESLPGYVDYAHPVQRRVMAALEDVCAISLKDAAWGADGCSIPTIAMPLSSFAHGLARFGTGIGLGAERGRAAGRLITAMTRAPQMVAGEGRFCTEFMEKTQGRIAAKVGAEGVYAAILQDHGLGVALKCEDGATRAAQVALAYIIDALQLYDGEIGAALTAFSRSDIKNRKGQIVGSVYIES